MGMDTSPHAELVDYLSACTAECWWVAQTRGRFEQRTAEEFRNYGGAAVVPMRQVRVTQSGGWRNSGMRSVRRTVDQVLFPGYVFLNGPAAMRVAASESPWVYGLIDVCRASVSAFRRELEAVCVAVACYPLLGMTDFRPGMKVKVVAGPLIGKEGLVDSIGEGRLRLSIQSFEKDTRTLLSVAEVEIPPDMVEPAGEN